MERLWGISPLWQIFICCNVNGPIVDIPTSLLFTLVISEATALPMWDHGFHFCLLHTAIAIWRGIFWLKWQGNKLGQMAGKLNWLEWQGKKN